MSSCRTTSKTILTIAATCAVVSFLGIVPPRLSAAESRPAPGFVTVAITHRVFVEFHDTLTVAMNQRHLVGDTEYSFELVEFYPDFAIDTNKAVTSMTDEPRNPAFKVVVYETDEKADETWAFYGVDIPHYGRKSYLAFKVLAFEYRGDVIGKAAGAPAQDGEEKKQ
jgi:hypothetical protein